MLVTMIVSPVSGRVSVSFPINVISVCDAFIGLTPVFVAYYVVLVRVNDIFGYYEFGLVDFVPLSRFSYYYISIVFIDRFKLYFEII